MATPSSSATTPSPRPRYLHSVGSASSSSNMPNSLPTSDGDERERLAQKITAGAHLGELALSLRARLLYANFKVRSNTSRHTLNELESANKHSPNGKRTTNFLSDPASPSGNAHLGGQPSRSMARKGPMAPPPPVTASAAQSLFSSLLAPPPAKRARTIHNPDDPPVPASAKVAEQIRSPSRAAKTAHGPDAHPKSKSRKAAKEKASAPSSGKAKGKAKQRVTAEGSFEVEREIDMAAAATLTTLLMSQQRPSISGTVGSPRSSISAGSDPGSVHSFAHYAQSAARTAAGETPVPSTSHQSIFGMGSQSTATPPHSPAMSQASPALSHATARRHSVTHGSGLRPDGGGTPKMTRGRADDTDAADMLLLMATSPSPARPTTTRDKDARDAAAFRALRGGGSGLKGRVLFPTYGGEDNAHGGGTPRMLSREMSGSFASVSSTATEPVSPRTIPATARRESMPVQMPSRLSMNQGFSHTVDNGHLNVPMLPTVTPPTPTDQAPSHLHPPALSSSDPQSPPMPPVDALSHASVGQHTSSFLAPHTPNASFSLSDYMNISPSPAVTLSRTSSTVSSQSARRLFEDR